MEWEQLLAQAGFRVTTSRRVVMQVLQTAGVPLEPHEILERGRCLHRSLGLVTIYRTLALLTALDLVRRVHRQDGCHGYVIASPGHRHHIICRQCGQATEFPGGDDIHALIERVENETGYRVDDHLLQLAGLCPACRELR
ncbi:MAG: transcriptional repressor [Anaerolineae bacterium]|nr:transcriptional repressor [Anaerolineae bacterium]